jgi:predicted nucleotide-binding protein
VASPFQVSGVKKCEIGTVTLFEELRLHAHALRTAVETNPAFFAGVIHYVRQLDAVASGKTASVSKRELQILAAKIEDFFKQWRPSGTGLYIPPKDASDSDGTVHEINRLVAEIDRLPDSQLIQQLPGDAPQVRQAVSEAKPKCVFVGHGHSRLWARLKAYLQDELGLAVVTYESKPRTGESIVPVLEEMLGQATFAIMILTAEDEVGEDKRRARQNVVHEAGLFQGRLGFRKAVLLVQDGVETFTNVDGLQHIRFSGDNIEQAFYELQRVLKREGQIS